MVELWSDENVFKQAATVLCQKQPTGKFTCDHSGLAGQVNPSHGLQSCRSGAKNRRHSDSRQRRRNADACSNL